ncbi:MAG TPA: L-serine ammonia-lyase, iron-sulfur-dependent, subunit alpha [Candidatus Limnocylindria bacterium]|nr:L-serine ammonia-lyase, iron-sulfur-dependent, subunit alpha [Candidatus Limnocylindria bacterium]
MDAITALLSRELKTAMGCTEPIAIAYCAALAARALGRAPEHIRVRCSGNVVKNAKAVVVPNTGGLRGIEAAAAAGALYGDPDAGLETLSGVTPEQAADLALRLPALGVQVSLLRTRHSLHVVVECAAGGDAAQAEIKDTHTHVASITRNGQKVLEGGLAAQDAPEADAMLTVEDILRYARTVPLDEVRPILRAQVENNLAIAREGLSGRWGSQIGRTVLESRGESPRAQLVAWAAAGSDARMNGCAMPVTINAGSGNQGLTVSVPVVLRAGQVGADEEATLRALIVSNLVSLHQKRGIGRLSAYCGAVTAAIGASAGIAFLEGAPDEQVGQVIASGLMIASGMLCDGAKSSCAAKIVASLDSALLAYDLARSGNAFQPGEGLAKPGVEQTISAVARVAREGMRDTDVTVLQAMLDQPAASRTRRRAPKPPAPETPGA